MKMKMKFKRFLSGVMAVATLASVIVQPIAVSASELEPEEIPFEQQYPELKEVLKANLYQDMVDKIISREEYREIKQTFSKKIAAAKESLKGLEEKKKRMLSNEMRTQQWVTEFTVMKNLNWHSWLSLIRNKRDLPGMQDFH